MFVTFYKINIFIKFIKPRFKEITLRTMPSVYACFILSINPFRILRFQQDDGITQ